MYIPSIYVSCNSYNCVAGNNTIVATNVAYTKLEVAGMRTGNNTGTSQVLWVIDQNSPTNLNVAALSPNIAMQPSTIIVNVEEFIPFFFRRPFYHSYGTIQTQQLSGTVATGIAFGPKAFVVSRGFIWNLGRDPGSGREVTDSQTWTDLVLNRATGVLTLNRQAKDYLEAPGIVNHYFTIIDPW